jgi:hypothetical protein
MNPIQLTQGEDKALEVLVTDPNGAAVDLVTNCIRVEAHVYSGETLLKKYTTASPATGEGLATTPGDPANLVKLLAAHADTKAWPTGQGNIEVVRYKTDADFSGPDGKREVFRLVPALQIYASNSRNNA